jgi:hypothetical protein
MTKRETPDLSTMQPVPLKEHQWLERLVGEWSYEGDATMELGKPSVRFTGTESVRSIGGLWIVAEGKGDMPGGGTATTIMTLGYDPEKKRYVGNWIGTMMAHLWQYEGSLDANGKTLTLDSVGPNMFSPGTMAKFTDAIEFKSDDHRVLISHILGEDGKWQQVMVATYRRKR